MVKAIRQGLKTESYRLNFQVMPMVRYCPTHGVLQTHEGGTEGKTGTDKAHQGND